MHHNSNTKRSNWFIDQLNLYQSANSDFESIKRNFIIRDAEFTIITQALLNKDTNDSLQHELILGRRGSGKSTLLKRIEIEINENRELNKKYIPINLAEEQAGIYRLFDLWEQVIEELQHQFAINENRKDFEEFDTTQNYTRHLYDVIHKTCIKHKKKIVLLLDNFDRIIENFSDDGNLLRETLINYNDIEIIAGSTRMDEHFWKYDMPFYEFFRKHRLESLSKEEMLLLLNHWADSLDITELKDFIKNNPGKLENIRILTDGLPRTLQFFIQIVLQNSQSHGYDYLKKIMDHVTPLYQERLNYLPAQLRKIVLEMAFIWEACTTKQLVEKTRLESKLVSANLKTLVLKGIVDKIGTSKKNHLYRISERFFNMWLIFTQGNPKQKRKAKCLSIFLENWYDANDFKNLVNNHIDLLVNKKIDYDNALILSKALSQSKYISLIQRDSILNLTEEINSKNKKSQLIHLPKKSYEILNQAIEELEKNNHKHALDLVNSLENEEDGVKFNFLGVIYEDQENYSKAEHYYLQAIKKGFSDASYNLAIIYQNQEKYKQAEKYFILALKNGFDEALNNLAIIYEKEHKYEKAEEFYFKAIKNNDINAIFNLGIFYQKQNKYDLAEKYYLMAIDENNEDDGALFNLARLYQEQENYERAEKYYLLTIKKGNIDSLNNLGVIYNKQKKSNLAKKYYQLAIEKNDSRSLFNLAILYQNEKNYEQAEKLYLEAIERGDNKALNNLGTIYEDQEKYDLAEDYYLQSIEKNDNHALFNLALLYQKQEKHDLAEHYYLQSIEKNDKDALFNLAFLYQKQEKYKEAEKYYLLAIKDHNTNATNNLAILYYNQNIKKKESLNLLSQNNTDPQNLIIAEIWNGIFNNLESRVYSIVQDDSDNLEDFIVDLLIHQQKNLVLKLFRNLDFGKNLQEKYAVLFYISMLLNNPNEENLELKIPPEIETTVKEIMELIKDKEKFYGYAK